MALSAPRMASRAGQTLRLKPGGRASIAHQTLPCVASAHPRPFSTAPQEQPPPPPCPRWRPISVLDDWVARDGRPLSVRQLMHFGRSLTEARLLSSANYVRTELPTRLAHRIRDMQQLPYAVVSNPHIHDVYELYYAAFDTFRKVKEIKTLDDNDAFCKIIGQNLRAHLPVIPKLIMGILESSELLPARDLDLFTSTVLSARISRRVIAEQHLALTETYNSSWYSPGSRLPDNHEFIGEVFLKCRASDVVQRCGAAVCALARSAYGPDVQLPAIQVVGDLDTTFPYILSHLEYIVGELLRNAVQAVVERHRTTGAGAAVPPIEVTLCETQQDVIIRVSDQGGGVPHDMLPYLWSFNKGAHSQRYLENLKQVPRMSATLQELRPELGADGKGNSSDGGPVQDYSLLAEKHHHHLLPGDSKHPHGSSLASLSQRPPNLRLGMGLPLSRVYAGYWAGSLELHSLDGYGVDAFLQISKLGNKNEQLIMRARMDCV